MTPVVVLATSLTGVGVRISPSKGVWLYEVLKAEVFHEGR